MYLGASEGRFPPSPPPSLVPDPALTLSAPFPRPPQTRGLITGFAMLKLFSSRSKQTHLREASNSIYALGESPIVHKSRTNSLYETIRNVRTYVCTFDLFRCKREIERSRSAFCIEKCGCSSFYLSCCAIVNLGWIAKVIGRSYHRKVF